MATRKLIQLGSAFSLLAGIAILLYVDLQIAEVYSQSSGKTRALFGLQILGRFYYRFYVSLFTILPLLGGARNIYTVGANRHDVIIVLAGLLLFSCTLIFPFWEWLAWAVY